jgi:3-oxoacyl-[acyl-carrier protein] reductase
MAFSLAGKHCAIVGATGVLGKSIAKLFSSQGAVLTLLSRSVQAARSELESNILHPYSSSLQVEDLTASRPIDHRFVPLDLTEPGTIADAFKSKGGVGSVDVLVNCAGISQTSILKRTSDEGIESIMNTNLVATILACKHAKMEQGGASINILFIH